MVAKNRSVLILAAGKGTRMKSNLPKPLHAVCGYPIVAHILKAAQAVNPAAIGIVIGHGAEIVKQTVLDNLSTWGITTPVEFFEQTELAGSGSAVKAALPFLQKHDDVMILNGDVPLLQADTLQAMQQAFNDAKAGTLVLSVKVPNPAGYGRIVCDADHHFKAIVEDADADAETKKICEINSGMYVFDSKALQAALSKLTPQGPKNEYYLTDTLALIKQAGLPAVVFTTQDYTQALGVNSRVELAQAAQIMRARINQYHMDNGVTLINPQDTYIDAGVEIGADTVIASGCYLLGNTKIGQNCTLESSVYIHSSTIHNDVTLKLGTYVEESEVYENCQLGPYAHLRPKSVLKKGAKVGNFSEIKKAVIGEGSKVNHLSYIGDTQMGAGVNVGAGTITCNYDGKNKHQTVIEDHVFIGSNVNFVAPVTVREYAKIGAGSTITKEVAAQGLAIARSRQVVLENKGVKKEHD
ncbi:MAG: bifunctional UDP-N-acetylglucosamine diphosphorylase/glucosamine-1-phosphate N-acetyltransferase GlmU [Elusimicrobiaceae bacterium]|nr:bifunctional UDP-N-acetylglucosamine diphosphorylase/glucosamine-1-phosphate N-acetyltransferase GlmU [Elusimicrobiaceae bacterium]MBP5617292.1 bifunctional UDP-N-acetylglucosamine diphosphorylase/glucosamine-1-phosphate N-acetyltransferase GlmU [Elusimicrobiaceae bacterium]